MFNTKKTISLDEEALILDGRRLPTHNSPKYFAAVDIIEAAQNREWLSTATRQISRYWQSRNEKKRVGGAEPISEKDVFSPRGENL